MIYTIKGVLKVCEPDYVIIETFGIGYQVFVAQTVQDNLPSIGQPVELYTYHHIREDNQQLFGFKTESQRRFFITLTAVSGVGPKVGIKILSVLTVEAFCQAVLNENISTLTQVSGVGKKMAERIIVELKDKLPKLFGNEIAALPEQEIVSSSSTLSETVLSDYTLALQSLGYSKEEIKRMLKKADNLTDNTAFEAGLKQLLQNA